MDEKANGSQAECCLQDTLGMGESIIENLRAPILVLNLELRVEMANRSFCHIFRLSNDETEGQPFFELDSGQWDIPELRRLLKEIFSGKSSVDDFEIEHEFASIGYRYMRLNVCRTLREKDQSECILLAIEDVTEQRRAEEAQRRAEEERREIESRFSTLVDNLQDHAVFTTDTAGYVTSWNVVAENILGYTAKETLGRHFSVFFTPEDVEQEIPQQELETAKETGRGEDERWHRRKNGELFWAIGIVTPTTNAENNHSGFSKILRDITDRKRTEEKLRRQSEQLQFLWDSAAALLTASDPQVMLEEMFQRVSEHLDVDAYFSFVVDESDESLRLVSCGGIPEDAARSIGQVEFGETGADGVMVQRRPIIATHIQQSGDPKAEFVKRHGLRTYVCNPLIFQDQLIGALCFASRHVDQFDREELAFFKTFAYYITVAYARLRLVEQLQEAHRRKDEFLAMLAHELRNPLAPIRSGLDVLAMEETEHAETIEMMQAQVTHVVRLVDDLLDISRIMRERIDLRREPVELSSLVQQSVEAVRSLVDNHQQELSVSVPKEPIYIDADSVRMVQVIENLLNNASKYTEVSGRIELIVERRTALASIIVRDTGIGIDSDLLPKIFDLFTQSDRSLDRAQGGLGIGLTLVKRLVELHGGTVSAHSEGPGHGSTFTVQFPTVEAVEQSEDVLEPFVTAADRRIVVVDDNKGAAWMLSKLLRKLGDHEIETAHDGPSALEKIKETHPEIVLLDIGLPGMDGYEVAKAVREIPEFDDVLLIALTGYGQKEDRRRSKEAGFDEHLTKPPSVDQMKTVLAHPKLSGLLG